MGTANATFFVPAASIGEPSQLFALRWLVEPDRTLGKTVSEGLRVVTTERQGPQQSLGLSCADSRPLDLSPELTRIWAVGDRTPRCHGCESNRTATGTAAATFVPAA